jgi:hypothetical protein
VKSLPYDHSLLQQVELLGQTKRFEELKNEIEQKDHDERDAHQPQQNASHRLISLFHSTG